MLVGHEYLAVVGEADLGARLLPQPVDGDERVGELWHASDAADEEAMEFAVGVAGDDGEVADEADLALDAVDARHCLARGALVDEVLGVGVAAHGAAAVEY